MKKNWFVYILECNDGSFYTGITTDIERRMQEHNQGKLGAKYTLGRRPVRLVYQAQCLDRSEASKSEYRIRKLARLEKLKLVENYFNSEIS